MVVAMAMVMVMVMVMVMAVVKGTGMGKIVNLRCLDKIIKLFIFY